MTGPFLDNMGIDMIKGGGKLFVGSGGRVVGPGHFGLLDLGDGVQKFSCTMKRTWTGAAPACWTSARCCGKTAGPSPARTSRKAPIEIESVRTGTALELAVEGVPVGGGAQAEAPDRRRPADRAAGGGPDGDVRRPGGAIPPQDVAQVSTNWPAGNIDIRMANYMCQAQQKWTITPVANAGGYPGSPYFKITIAGTDRALAATEDAELVALPAFTGGPEQLWRIDQLTDGT